MESGFLLRVTAQDGPIGPIHTFRLPPVCAFQGSHLSGYIKPSMATPETTAECQPLMSRRTLLLYEGRVDNRSQVAARLGSRHLAVASDGEVLLAAADRWGATLQQHVVGDYGFALLDKADSTVVVGRDSLGIRRVYYHSSERALTAASSLRLLLAGLDSTPRLDPDGIAQFVCLSDLRATRTVFADVHIVPPGGSLIWRSGVARLLPGWTPILGPELSEHPAGILEEECRHLLNEAVSATLRSPGRVCVELSGGLDSSTVTAVVGKAWRRCGSSEDPPLALSYTYANESFPMEASCREQVLNVCGLPSHTIDMEPFHWFGSFIDDPPCEPLALLASPEKDQCVSALIRCLDLRTCLTGHGGNEVFGTSLEQPLFLCDWFRQLRLREWWSGVRTYSQAGRSNVAHLVGLSLMSGWPEEEVRRPHWLTVGDRQFSLRSYYELLAPARGNLYPAQAVQLMFARRAAVGKSRPFPWDERHPLLYRPLVEFMLRVPWGLKTTVDGVRQLLRRTTDPWLPDTVRKQNKAAAGHNLLRTFARDWKSIAPLAEGRLLGEYSFVQPALFFDACQRLSHGFASKSQPLGGVWNALALERWLQLDGPAQGDVARTEYRQMRRRAFATFTYEAAGSRSSEAS